MRVDVMAGRYAPGRRLVQTRVDSKIAKALEKLAREEDRTVADYVRRVLNSHVDERLKRAAGVGPEG